ncbi:ATP-binding protein [Aestuariibius sp. 2305UL40-4]|uniref:ATP-binding protein n=1 Tax=Aestuariibius violaceus TaxID=3234132 RepID=UPI00345EBA2B
MLTFNLLVAVALGYVALLFLVAFMAERRAARGRDGWLRSPLIYTLSLSIYCTAWTFYGAVGYAARSGLEFLVIYLGPTLVLVGWWAILRKLVRVGRAQRITSVADLISSRFGKSNTLGVIVTLIAVIATTPYIALQLQSVTLSVRVFAEGAWSTAELEATAFWVAAGLALFTILFGTRNLDVNERHHGVVMAIAVEAVVKLFALLAVGIFVVWSVADGPADVMAKIDASPLSSWEIGAGRWAGLIFLSAAAFICLPRMFHVLVVENADERHLATAGWAFPLYLGAMSLFVVPIAVVGLEVMPVGANPDLFVLTLPLALEAEGLALLSFLGGLSSATSMVIVASIALSIMVSNHIVMPIWLSAGSGGATMSGDVRRIVILSRRFAIAGVLALGWLYFRLSGAGTSLAAIGLISFVGIAQVLPSLLGGLYWRGATRIGAGAGLIVGFAIWAYTLFVPALAGGSNLVVLGPAGIGWLRPQELFGFEGMDPVLHAVLWSMLLNTLAFFVGSVLTFPTPLERLQGAQVVHVFDHTTGPRGWRHGVPEVEDLLIMAQRILGAAEAQALFQAEAERQGSTGYLPEVTPEFLDHFERELAGSVGAATAHAMVGQMIGGTAVSVEDLIAVADETAQMMEYSSRLEAQSAELTRTARQLRDANEKLTALSIQKDAFLSQVSHELRTPMTSIRSFSELMRDGAAGPEEQARFAGIIQDEAVRLTRLLDDILDLSVMENGQVSLNISTGNLADLIDRAIAATGLGPEDLRIVRDREAERAVTLETDLDRLSQVFINVISNAGKYCDAEAPELRIEVRGGAVDLIDNGSGIPKDSRRVIFEKFSRLSDQSAAGGAGLGLAICREIMEKLGGSISYLPGQGGAAFRIGLPERRALAAQ